MPHSSFYTILDRQGYGVELVEPVRPLYFYDPF